jgi:hypothetical protein
MGMTAADRAKRDAEIQALVQDQHADDTSHAEKQAVVTEDATIGNEERLRGIPAVGRVSGTMKNTRPEPGAAARLASEERDLRSSRDLHAAMMRKARANLGRKETT